MGQPRGAGAKEITANAPGGVKVLESASNGRGARRHRAAPGKQSFAQRGGRWEESRATPQDGIYSPPANQAALSWAPGWAGSRQRHNDQTQAHSKSSSSTQAFIRQDRYLRSLNGKQDFPGHAAASGRGFEPCLEHRAGCLCRFPVAQEMTTGTLPPPAAAHPQLPASCPAASPRSPRKGCTAWRAGFH